MLCHLKTSSVRLNDPLNDPIGPSSHDRWPDTSGHRNSQRYILQKNSLPTNFKNNDESILKPIMSNNIEDIKSLLNEEDVFIVDRGFRDSLSMLVELRIQHHMPSFLSKGEKQMTTADQCQFKQISDQVNFIRS